MSHHSCTLRGALTLLTTFAALAASNTAYAGGFWLADRGGRPLGRGGAMVAGADDGHALWYNPAGLGFADNHVLADGTLAFFSAEFQRLDASGEGIPAGPNGGNYPAVEASHAPLPIPTLAVIHDLGMRDMTFGVGVFAPNQVALEWPSQVSIDGVSGQPAPQRYSLLSQAHSAIATGALAAAYHGVPGLSLGAAFYVTGGTLRTVSVLSGCDGFVCTFPESPADDIYVDLNLGPTATVGGTLGAIYQPHPMLRLGASFTLPYALSGEAEADLSLPDSPAYREAEVIGNRIDVTLEFPWVARAGVEVRPSAGLRVEAAYVLEAWGSHDALDITPQGIRIEGVLGVDDYEVGPVQLVRDMQHVHSLRLGGEYTLGQLPLVLRAGVLLENGAFPDDTLSAFTPDSDKLFVGLGGSYRVLPKVWLDVMLGHSFMRNRQVRDSRVTQPNGVRPAPEQPTLIGNGDYAVEASFAGLGLRYLLDDSSKP